MRFARSTSPWAAGALAACVAAAASGAGLSAAQAASPAGRARALPEWPVVRLIVAQRVITAQRFGKYVFFDPGVYVGVSHSPLQIDVGRRSYTSPVTVTQIIRLRGGAILRRRLPAWVNASWGGLGKFMRVSMRDSAGNVVLSQDITVCPASFPQKTGPGSPQNPLYPQQGCGANDPFPRGEVWAIQRGWAVDPFYFHAQTQLPLGTYHMTMRINHGYAKLLHVTAPHAVARVTIDVVQGTGCCIGPASRRPGPAARTMGQPTLGQPTLGQPTLGQPTLGQPALGQAPPGPSQVPLLDRPPRDALPDLVPLPAWRISVRHLPATPTQPAADLIEFNGTVWNSGSGPFDVEGFRHNGSPVMPAYQYFWRDGRVIGRVRAGTMGFGGTTGSVLWHFQQFAAYRLLNADRKLVVTSGKVGFCIAPTDQVNMLLPHAVWNQQFFGYGGTCGSQSALWVQEELPVGWGDTYAQFGPGQAFVINTVPNGTYYIETIANPGHVLRETNTANDVTLRKIILGGTPGHRTVKVPPWHGIDPEP